MHVKIKRKHKRPVLIMGHLYMNKFGGLYLAVAPIEYHSIDNNQFLVSVGSGIPWPNSDDPFKSGEWKDVTEEYCITEMPNT